MLLRSSRPLNTIALMFHLATGLLIFSLPNLAQDAPFLRRGNTEVGGFVGSSYGADQWRIMGGGNVAVAVNRYIMPYGEFSYFPGIGRKQSIDLGGGRRANATFSIPLADFHGGIHLRLSGGQSPVVPYLVAGVGGIRTFARTETVTIQDSLGSTSIPIPVPAETNFAANFGGGIRYYTTERFGLRIEAKLYKPTGTFTDPFYKIEGGFFFQIH
jgi:hypothetical protein